MWGKRALCLADQNATYDANTDVLTCPALVEDGRSVLVVVAAQELLDASGWPDALPAGKVAAFDRLRSTIEAVALAKWRQGRSEHAGSTIFIQKGELS